MKIFQPPYTIRDAATGEPYLTRYILISCKYFRIFLHKIHREDRDRVLHNHPWSRMFSLILRGGYCETRLTPETCSFSTTYLAPSINSIPEKDYHKITKVLPGTWTLFFAGRRTRVWGFLTDKGHVNWREYLGLPEGSEEVPE